MSEEIIIEYDITEFRGRTSVSPLDFSGKTIAEIEQELRDFVNENGTASFAPTNCASDARKIFDAIEAQRLEDEAVMA